MSASPLRHFPPLLLTALGLAACDQFEDPDIAQIRSIQPDSGAIGSLVEIQADNLLDNTRVIFPDEVVSPMAALFLDRVVTIVPAGATSGEVVLETGGERSSSRADFRVVPPPPSTPAFFESATGEPILTYSGGCDNIPALDDGFASFSLPFEFPFYGRPQAQMFVSTNGLVTFNEPRPCDNNGRANSFVNADKIAIVNFDLSPGHGGEVRVNVTDPEKVVVTWSEVALCGLRETSNTFQLVLFPDGRIRMNFGYLSTRGVGTDCLLRNSTSGSLTGITPLTAQSLTTATYSVQPSLVIEPQTGVVNPFFVDRFFDLENRSLLFTPLETDGVFNGYRVEVLPTT